MLTEWLRIVKFALTFDLTEDFMKRLLLVSAALVVSMQLFAQGPVQKFMKRFEDPEKGRVVFVEKGSRSIGIMGSYRNFNASGSDVSDGYSILSMLNLGTGRLNMWTIAPKFQYFVADDLSVDVRLGYTGYLVDTDIRVDLRDALGGLFDDMDGYDPSALNVTVSNRHYQHHAGSISFAARKYLSFFGSKMLGVFGEGRMYGKYGVTTSYPVPEAGEPVAKMRVSNNFNIGFKVAAGAALRLRDGSAITVSIPIFGIAYDRTHQNKQGKNVGNQADLSSFKIARDLDFLGIQLGYSRFITPKKK